MTHFSKKFKQAAFIYSRPKLDCALISCADSAGLIDLAVEFLFKWLVRVIEGTAMVL